MIHYIHVIKQYGGRTAVNDVSFELARGEFFGLLGKNGAGKTSLLRMTEALTAPSAGRIEIDGVPVHRGRCAVKQKLGIVPQHNNLEHELTLRQNMEYHGRLYGMAARERRERIEELLAMADMNERRDEMPRHFSGGQQRLLMILKALMHHPEILLLDEPTAGLDPQARRSIWRLLEALGRSGLTIFLTTHYMEEAQALCGRVGFLDRGKLAALDTPQAIIAQTGGGHEATLEDAFMMLTGHSGGGRSGLERGEER